MVMSAPHGEDKNFFRREFKCIATAVGSPKSEQWSPSRGLVPSIRTLHGLMPWRWGRDCINFTDVFYGFLTSIFFKHKWP
jgi:hypothetical protein